MGHIQAHMCGLFNQLSHIVIVLALILKPLLIVLNGG
jgi:hypothetical protein